MVEIAAMQNPFNHCFVTHSHFLDIRNGHCLQTALVCYTGSSTGLGLVFSGLLTSGMIESSTLDVMRYAHVKIMSYQSFIRVSRISH